MMTAPDIDNRPPRPWVVILGTITLALLLLWVGVSITGCPGGSN